MRALAWDRVLVVLPAVGVADLCVVHPRGDGFGRHESRICSGIGFAVPSLEVQRVALAVAVPVHPFVGLVRLSSAFPPSPSLGGVVDSALSGRFRL